MSIAVCPGSFDPVTNGHVDVFRRSARQFDQVVVTVMINESKRGMFTVDERIALIRQATADLSTVRVESWHGLLVHYAQEIGATAIVKGLRGSGDFEYELPMAHMNKSLTGIDTYFLPADPSYGHLSSSLVKEVAGFGGDVEPMLPEPVHRAVVQRLAERSNG